MLLAFAEDGRLAGGARAVRHRDDPGTADVAVTVGDPSSARGLGSKLLELLGTAALAEGIDRLAGHVLVDNPGGRGLLVANGAMCRLDEPVCWPSTSPSAPPHGDAEVAQRRLAS